MFLSPSWGSGIEGDSQNSPPVSPEPGVSLELTSIGGSGGFQRNEGLGIWGKNFPFSYLLYVVTIFYDVIINTHR